GGCNGDSDHCWVNVTNVACADINTGIQAVDHAQEPIRPSCIVCPDPEAQASCYVDQTCLQNYTTAAAQYNDYLARAQGIMYRRVLAAMPLSQLRTMIDNLTAYKDPSTVPSLTSTACQATADQYGIIADSTTGTSGDDTQTWWLKSGCSAKASWLDPA